MKMVFTSFTANMLPLGFTLTRTAVVPSLHSKRITCFFAASLWWFTQYGNPLYV